MLHSWVSWLKTVQWKNERAGPNSAYSPTTIEHWANVVTHGVWIGPSILGVYDLLRRCQTHKQYLAASLYGASLFLIFSVSTCFHSIFLCYQGGHLKDVLHRCDRAVIYIFIAGSYFPWTLLLDFPSDSMSEHVSWLIWVLATAGITYQQLYHERYKTVETLFYCCMGILPAVMLNASTELKGYEQMRQGGLIYLTGVFFFKADGRIPCAHAIWHCFVAAAACIHYFTIAHYLFPDSSATSPLPLNYFQKVDS